MKIYKRPKRKDGGYWDNEYCSNIGDPSVNIVCIKCRIIKRVKQRMEDMGHGIDKCPRCHKKMTHMWCKIRLPKKSDDKAWKKLERKL